MDEDDEKLIEEIQQVLTGFGKDLAKFAAKQRRHQIMKLALEGAQGDRRLMFPNTHASFDSAEKVVAYVLAIADKLAPEES